MTILELARLTDEQARDYMEKLRWPNGPVCPHCQGTDCTRLSGEKHRPGTIQCNNGECRQQFTVTVGSVMERSKVPLVKWVMAFHLLCSSKKGFSALQLQRELGLGSYKTAWFMLHRIRHAMADHPQAAEMKGIVEVDETYVGGKPPKAKPGEKPAWGRSTKKTPVVVLVERGGKAHSMPVKHCDQATLHTAIKKSVDKSSMIVTDQFNGYHGIGRHFDGGHQTVNHTRRQYARRRAGVSIHTNTAESFFSLLKRGFVGVYHKMGKQHLHRYCAEFDFRWNHNQVTDHVRMEAAIKRVGGKRLMYQAARKSP